jgi:predicted peroxiredoxin
MPARAGDGSRRSRAVAARHGGCTLRGAMSDKKKLVVLLAHNANDDKSTVAFTIANAALSTGMEVAVFLTSDAVELSREGGHDLTHVQPFKKLDELVDGFLEQGGVVWACTPCYRHRGLKEGDNKDKVVITGAGPLIEWVQAGAATISL